MLNNYSSAHPPTYVLQPISKDLGREESGGDETSQTAPNNIEAQLKATQQQVANLMMTNRDYQHQLHQTKQQLSDSKKKVKILSQKKGSGRARGGSRSSSRRKSSCGSGNGSGEQSVEERTSLNESGLNLLAQLNDEGDEKPLTLSNGTLLEKPSPPSSSIQKIQHDASIVQKFFHTLQEESSVDDHALNINISIQPTSDGSPLSLSVPLSLPPPLSLSRPQGKGESSGLGDGFTTEDSAELCSGILPDLVLLPSDSNYSSSELFSSQVSSPTPPSLDSTPREKKQDPIHLFISGAEPKPLDSNHIVSSNHNNDEWWRDNRAAVTLSRASTATPDSLLSSSSQSLASGSPQKPRNRCQIHRPPSGSERGGERDRERTSWSRSKQLIQDQAYQNWDVQTQVFPSPKRAHFKGSLKQATEAFKHLLENLSQCLPPQPFSPSLILPSSSSIATTAPPSPTDFEDTKSLSTLETLEKSMEDVVNQYAELGLAHTSLSPSPSPSNLNHLPLFDEEETDNKRISPSSCDPTFDSMVNGHDVAANHSTKNENPISLLDPWYANLAPSPNSENTIREGLFMFLLRFLLFLIICLGIFLICFPDIGNHIYCHWRNISNIIDLGLLFEREPCFCYTFLGVHQPPSALT